jgi:hypothetical protein
MKAGGTLKHSQITTGLFRKQHYPLAACKWSSRHILTMNSGNQNAMLQKKKSFSHIDGNGAPQSVNFVHVG